jgi:hypothetical protein
VQQPSGLLEVLSQRVIEGAALEPSRRTQDGARSTAPLTGSTVDP